MLLPCRLPVKHPVRPPATGTPATRSSTPPLVRTLEWARLPGYILLIVGGIVPGVYLARRMFTQRNPTVPPEPASAPASSPPGPHSPQRAFPSCAAVLQGIRRGPGPPTPMAGCSSHSQRNMMPEERETPFL